MPSARASEDTHSIDSESPLLQPSSPSRETTWAVPAPVPEEMDPSCKDGS